MKNIIVCIEGSDGIGKETQTKLLTKSLNGTRIEYPYYDSVSGCLIDDVLTKNILKDQTTVDRALLIQSLMTKSWVQRVSASLRL